MADICPDNWKDVCGPENWACQLLSLRHWKHTLFCRYGIISDLLLAGYLVLLFGTVSISAFDFMCPNLNTLAKKSRMSPGFIGVTFLAFGNSSVDIFGTIAAISAGSSSLAIGAIVGGALFICTVVIGSMALYGAFEVDKVHFVRDGSFLLAASILVLYIINDGVVTLLEAFELLILYCIYAAVVLSQQWSPAEEHAGALAPHISVYSHESHDSPQESEDTQSINAPVRSSLFSAIEFQDSIRDGSISPSVRSSRSSTHLLIDPSHSIGPPLPPSVPNSGIRIPRSVSVPTSGRQSPVKDQPVLPTLITTDFGNALDQIPQPYNAEHSETAELREHTVKGHVFPSMVGFREKSILSKLHSVVMILPFLLLSISVPVEEAGLPHSMLLVHTVGCPLIILDLVDNLKLALAGSALALFLLYAGRARIHELSITILGFFMAVLWVVNLSQEVVQVLRRLGQVSKIPETILGLTVFAVGDSLGDLVSNISIAQLGMPTMAMAACFAGPLLTILIGVGMGSLIFMATKRTSHVEIVADKFIWTSGSLLVFTLAFLLVAVPLNKWKIESWMGKMTIGIWVSSVVINIVLHK